MEMKGIVLAGGAGTRLYPMTQITSKQLQPVYDKPMIYYPISTLMLAGLREILVISTPRDLPRFEELLGNGRQWGVDFTYAMQEQPGGIAQAFLLAEDFLAGSGSVLILGDNLFYGEMNLDLRRIMDEFAGGACIFGYPVRDPERYGVVEFAADGRVLSLEEKPEQPKSRYAVPGLYLYDSHASEYSKRLQPSARGELEITDLNRRYLAQGSLQAIKLGRGVAWLDTGTPASFAEAAMFIHAIEARQGLKIACLEEVAWRMGYITGEEFKALAAAVPASGYGDYLMQIVREEL